MSGFRLLFLLDSGCFAEEVHYRLTNIPHSKFDRCETADSDLFKSIYCSLKGVGFVFVFRLGGGGKLQANLKESESLTSPHFVRPELQYTRPHDHRTIFYLEIVHSNQIKRYSWLFCFGSMYGLIICFFFYINDESCEEPSAVPYSPCL